MRISRQCGNFASPSPGGQDNDGGPTDGGRKGVQPQVCLLGLATPSRDLLVQETGRSRQGNQLPFGLHFKLSFIITKGNSIFFSPLSISQSPRCRVSFP